MRLAERFHDPGSLAALLVLHDQPESAAAIALALVSWLGGRGYGDLVIQIAPAAIELAMRLVEVVMVP